MAPTASGVVLSLFCFLLCGYHHVQASIFEQAPAMSNAPLFNYGTMNGDTEIKDITISQSIDLPYNITYFGTTYRNLYISPDGTLGFEKATDYTGISYSEGVRNPMADMPFLAPLYFKALRPHNLNPSTYQGSMFYRLIDSAKLQPDSKYFSQNRELLNFLGDYLQEAVINPPKGFTPTLAAVVTWDNIPKELGQDDPQSCVKAHPCPGATFQVVLVSDQASTFAIFNYLKLDFEIDQYCQAGVNGGEGRGWFNIIPCHSRCQTRLNSSSLEDLPLLQGSDLQGRFILNVGGDAIKRGGCLPTELDAGMLELYPQTVGMFGGERLEVSGRCLAAASKFYCRFGNVARNNAVVTTGTMSNSMKGYCPVPLLTTKGDLDVYWSEDGQVWTAVNDINVVDAGRVPKPVSIDPAWLDQWNSRDAARITVPWDPRSFTDEASAKVNIKLIGYREIPAQRKVEYKDLEHIGSALNSDGKYVFEVGQHRCKQNCEDFEIGILEVGLPSDFHGSAGDRIAMRYGPIPLGWYVNEELEEQRGSDWSDQKCREWHVADTQESKWLTSLLPCPCSLSQALVDFGRWQPDPGCNLFKGSQCHYHKGAKHCVRSVTPTFEGAGNQCCYNFDGTLRYSQLSYEGSTPDRSHVWGSYPYSVPDRVPSLSHWRHDVVSFYYCCLWNEYDLCDLYMERRPTADCKNYDVPGIGFIRGDPHITTFDGQVYQFIGEGDYWLARADLPGRPVLIQGKFDARANSWDLGNLRETGSWKPKALIGLATKTNSATIEVTIAPGHALRPRGLDIRVNNHHKFFFDQGSLWQDYDDFIIINNADSERSNRHDNFTILLTGVYVGINVVARNGLLHVTVAAPPTLKPEQGKDAQLQGLLGSYDGNADNDFTSRQGGKVSPGVEKIKIFEQFAQSWNVRPENYEKLFHFHKTAEKLDPTHSFYEFNQIPRDFDEAPTMATVKQFCEGNENCEWDYQITGDREVARATREADHAYGFLRSSAYRVENCGLPAVGSMAILSAYNFSVGQEITATGCGSDKQFGGEVTYKCLRETVDEAKEHDREDYGITRMDPDSKVAYITHWVPRPDTVCSDESASLGMEAIIGIAVGCAVGVILIIVVIVLVVKKRKSSSSGFEEKKPRAATRGSRTQDPAAAEAMLTKVEDRSPIYKPSEDRVRMSEIRDGSSV